MGLFVLVRGGGGLFGASVGPRGHSPRIFQQKDCAVTKDEWAMQKLLIGFFLALIGISAAMSIAVLWWCLTRGGL